MSLGPRQVTGGATDVSCTVRVVDSADGTPETGVAFNTAGVDLWYRRDGGLEVSITEATQTVDGAHSDGGFVHISDGVCRLDLPDAAVAAGVAGVQVGGTFTGMVVFGPYIQIDAPVNVTKLLGTAWLTPGTAGTPDVNTKLWGGTAVASAVILAAANIASDAFTAAKFAASSLNGKGDWNIGKTGYALSAAGVQAIWDALTSALTTVGSIGKLLVDNINATISSRSSHSAADVWSSATRTLTAATNITSTGGATVPQTGDSFALVSTEVAQILALLDDPRSEPGQGAPPVNPDLATKIDYLYKAWRNKKTQTSSEQKLFADDATTVDQKASVSDDGTTLTVGEVATGP